MDGLYSKGDIIRTLFLDFRKAFDLVDHSILLSKLSTYKFSDATYTLLASYLHNRQQVMNSGKGMSQPASIKSGVPQGSILGPTLFLMFINDMHLYMEYCDTDYYADDTTVHINEKKTRSQFRLNYNSTLDMQNFGVHKIKCI